MFSSQPLPTLTSADRSVDAIRGSGESDPTLFLQNLDLGIYLPGMDGRLARGRSPDGVNVLVALPHAFGDETDCSLALALEPSALNAFYQLKIDLRELYLRTSDRILFSGPLENPKKVERISVDALRKGALARYLPSAGIWFDNLPVQHAARTKASSRRRAMT